jgi:hypothetical protein
MITAAIFVLALAPLPTAQPQNTAQPPSNTQRASTAQPASNTQKPSTAQPQSNTQPQSNSQAPIHAQSPSSQEPPVRGSNESPPPQNNGPPGFTLDKLHGLPLTRQMWVPQQPEIWIYPQYGWGYPQYSYQYGGMGGYRPPGVGGYYQSPMILLVR